MTGRAFAKIRCAALRIMAVFLALFVLFSSFRLISSAQVEVYRSVRTDTMRIALTFDDGPHPRLTNRILQILDQYHVKATFFMIGENVKYYPETARAVIAAGHEVGNHTYSHHRLSKMDMDSLEKEVEECEDILEKICQYRPRFFRPPEGALSAYVRNYTEQEHYTVILWSVDTRDWENKDAERIAQYVLDNIHPGDIVLMHDFIGTKSKTPEALEILLPKLLAQGYEPVTVSELLGVA